MAAPTAYVTTFQGNSMTPTDFSLALENISLAAKGKLSGVAVHLSSGNVVVDDGWCVVKGRIIRVSHGELENIQGSGTQTKYVYLSVDLSTNDPATISVGDSVPTDGDNFNSAGTRAYLQLASLVVDSTGVVSCTNIGQLDMKAHMVQSADLVTTTTAVNVVKNALTVETVMLGTVTVPAGSNKTAEKAVTKSGYKPLGVVGYTIVKSSSAGGTGAGVSSMNRIYLTDSTQKVTAIVVNPGSSNVVVDVKAMVLYVKE